MVGPILYLFLVFVEFLLALSIFLYISFLLFSSFMGSPYVPTKQKEVDLMLKRLRPKKGESFLDLGCGDGRVVATAVKDYAVVGTGVDINPLLILRARLKWGRTKGQLNFKVKNLHQINLSNYRIIYLFLMPELLVKLKPKLLTAAKKGSTIVSHGFKIEGFDKLLAKKINSHPFPTYFYQNS